MVDVASRRWTPTEVNGGRVDCEGDGERCLLSLQAARRGYANAQLDDYHGVPGATFRWSAGTRLALRARFSATESDMIGTAGFGFWNVPFGPGAGLRVRLPRAVWFFFASGASDLPLAPIGRRGCGWFVSTIDSMSGRALRWAGVAVPALGFMQFSRWRRLLWPLIRRDLTISFERVHVDMRAWHTYEIRWRHEHTMFFVDDRLLLATPMSPRGPLGFVTWIDNQALVARPTGRLCWKTESGPAQWLELSDIRLERIQ